MLRTLYLILVLMGLFPLSSTVMADTPKISTILVWGDSLSAAYGIPVEKGWVNLMRTKLGTEFNVVNGSISGETTAGGLSRLPKALADYQPDYVLIELGANDGLHGIATDIMKANLSKMIELSQANHAKVVLIGIQLPPNFGNAFTDKFDATYTDLAKQYNLPLVPSLMTNVAENWDLIQADGLHPTAEAQPLLLENVWKVVETVLKPTTPAKS